MHPGGHESKVPHQLPQRTLVPNLIKLENCEYDKAQDSYDLWRELEFSIVVVVEAYGLLPGGYFKQFLIAVPQPVLKAFLFGF